MEGFNFLTFLEAAYRRKYLLIIPAVAGLVISIILSIVLPSYYKSSTLVLLEEQQVPETYVTPTDETTFAQRINTISQQILSRTRLEQIVNDFNLDRQTSGQGVISRVLGILTAEPRNKEELIAQVRRNIEFKVIRNQDESEAARNRNRRTEAFTISYIGKDPYVTMQVTNTIASLFIEENLKIREQYSEGTSEFLSGELDKAKEELETQEAALRKFKERQMGSLPEQLDANLRTLDRLQLELQSVTDTLKNAEDRKAFLEEQLGVGQSGLAGPANTQIAELERLRSELTSLLSVYKESYPDVLLTKKRIKEIESQLEKRGRVEEIRPELRNTEAYANLISVRSQIDTLRKREREVVSQIREYEKRVDYTPSNEQKLADLRRDYNISLQNYQALLEKKLNARLAENLEKRQKGERFRVIDPANLPEESFKPNRPFIVLTGLLAGAGFGIGLIILFEFLHPAFRKEDDLADAFGLPVMATIPSFYSDAVEPEKLASAVKKVRKPERE